ncbi:MAG: hypothetical protein AVDCRST_MAG40-3392, partial [uncultured Gemmatimonadaceae bacterium]
DARRRRRRRRREHDRGAEGLDHHPGVQRGGLHRSGRRQHPQADGARPRADRGRRRLDRRDARRRRRRVGSAAHPHRAGERGAERGAQRRARGVDRPVGRVPRRGRLVAAREARGPPPPGGGAAGARPHPQLGDRVRRGGEVRRRADGVGRRLGARAVALRQHHRGRRLVGDGSARRARPGRLVRPGREVRRGLGALAAHRGAVPVRRHPRAAHLPHAAAGRLRREPGRDARRVRPLPEPRVRHVRVALQLAPRQGARRGVLPRGHHAARQQRPRRRVLRPLPHAGPQSAARLRLPSSRPARDLRL